MSESVVKEYVVRLSEAERETLEAFIRTGKSPAAQVLKARILLKADVSEAGEGWSDGRIVTALDTSLSTVSRTRQRACKAVGFLCQEGARASCCARDEGGPFGAVL
jgi:hypothetical protein